MSYPISTCQIVAAANGDQEMFNILCQRLFHNFKCGHWSIIPCKCSPKCDATEEALAELEKAISARIGQQTPAHSSD